MKSITYIYKVNFLTQKEMQPYTGVVMFFLSHIVDPLKAKDKDLRH